MLQIKFNNGFWKVFDTVAFKDVALCETLKAAEAVISKMIADRKAKKI